MLPLGKCVSGPKQRRQHWLKRAVGLAAAHSMLRHLLFVHLLHRAASQPLWLLLPLAGAAAAPARPKLSAPMQAGAARVGDSRRGSGGCLHLVLSAAAPAPAAFAALNAASALRPEMFQRSPPALHHLPLNRQGWAAVAACIALLLVFPALLLLLCMCVRSTPASVSHDAPLWMAAVQLPQPGCCCCCSCQVAQAARLHRAGRPAPWADGLQLSVHSSSIWTARLLMPCRGVASHRSAAIRAAAKEGGSLQNAAQLAGQGASRASTRVGPPQQDPPQTRLPQRQRSGSACLQPLVNFCSASTRMTGRPACSLACNCHMSRSIVPRAGEGQGKGEAC